MSYYGRGDGLGIQNLGAAADAASGENQGFWQNPGVRFVATTGSILSVPALAYHGYKRNRSVGWAIVWGVFGSIVWPVTLPIAFAQGYAKPRTRRNRRVRANTRRRRSRGRRRTSRRRRRTSRRRRRTSR